MFSPWLIIVALMIGVDVLTAFFHSTWISVIGSLAVFLIGYIILRRDPFVNLRLSMIFLGLLTVIDIAYVLGFISRFVMQEAFFALVLWSWVGLYHALFKYFLLGVTAYNAWHIWRTYTDVGLWDIPTTVVALGAIIGIAYIDSRRG